MSLYIGKNNTGNSILHITSNSVDASLLKEGVQPSTVFHTDLQFITGKIFDLNVTHTNNYYHDVSVGELPNAAVVEISSRFSGSTVPVVLIIVDNKVYLNLARLNATDLFLWNYIDNPYLPNSRYEGHGVIVPTSTHKYKCISGMYSTMKIVLTNMDYNEAFDSISIRSIFVSSNNSVSLTNNSITVKGINLASVPFMTHKNINSSTSFEGNSEGDRLYVPSASLTQTCNLSASSSRVYIKNSLNEILFDTSMGVLYVPSFIITPSFSTLVEFNGSYKITYINNVTPEYGKALFFCMFMSAWYPTFADKAVPSFMYIPSSEETFITTLAVTASQTTYSYTIYTSYVGTTLRVCFKKQLIHIGADGNPGLPPDLVFHKAVRIQ